MNFQQTGQSMAVNTKELTEYVQKLLLEYDYKVDQKQKLPELNPYRMPITYMTNEGKMVLVPESVQRKAIDMHYTIAGRRSEAGFDPKTDKAHPPGHHNQQNQPVQKVKKYVYQNRKELITLAILILALIIAYYVLNRLFNGYNQIVVPNNQPNVQYTLVR